MSEKKEAIRVLVTASGTGGHLFPALYVIDELLRRNIHVEFVGAGKALEEEVIGRAGIQRHVLTSAGLKNRGIAGIIRFLVTFPRAFFQVWTLLSRLKPDVVVGLGGYVTFFPITIARLRGIPTWIHEAELNPGVANDVLSLYASRVSLAFPATKMRRGSNTIYTGHPVRPELEQISDSKKPSDAIRRVLVLGGSQGARSLDRAMIELIGFLKTHSLVVWHQCRKESYEELKQLYEGEGVEHKLMTFIRDLPEAYSWSDIIVSRAGAGAIMEIGVVNRPTIFVPYPHAQGNHQYHNAMTLVEHGKGVLVEEGENFSERLRHAIFELLDKDAYQEMVQRVIATRPENATVKICEGCLELAQVYRERSSSL